MPKKIVVDGNAFAEKHARNLKASIQDIQRGVENVTVAPTAQAAAKKDKMRNNLNAAIDNGKWEAGLRRVSLEDWKKNFLSKGVNRISDGIDAAHDKMVAFGTSLLTYEQGVQNKVHAMADLTFQDSVNRVTTWMTDMKKYSRKG